MFDLIEKVLALSGLFILVRGTWFWINRRLGCKKTPEEIEHWRKIKKELDTKLPYHSSRNRGEVIVRDIGRMKDYPDTGKDTNSRRTSSWFKTEVKGLYHDGLEVYTGMMKYAAKDRGTDVWQVSDGEVSDRELKCWEICRIPFDFIVNVDWDGDNYCPVPHLFCKFAGILGSPYVESLMYVEVDPNLRLWPMEHYDPLRPRLSPWLRFRVWLWRKKN